MRKYWERASVYADRDEKNKMFVDNDDDHHKIEINLYTHNLFFHRSAAFAGIASRYEIWNDLNAAAATHN
jgi:hypothetical protein